MAATINGHLAKPWAAFNLPPGVPAPVFKFLAESKEDVGKLATLIDTLQNAGLLVDPEEMSARFGMKLTRTTAAQLPASDQTGLAGALAPLAASGAKLTLPHPAADGQAETPDTFDAIALQAQKEFQEGGGQATWAERMLDSMEDALSDDTGSGIRRMGSAEAMELFDTAAMAKAIEAALIAGAASGMAEKAAELADKARQDKTMRYTHAKAQRR